MNQLKERIRFTFFNIKKTMLENLDNDEKLLSDYIEDFLMDFIEDWEYVLENKTCILLSHFLTILLITDYESNEEFCESIFEEIYDELGTYELDETVEE